MKFRYRGRGGYREGAGRPKKPGAGVLHVTRPALAARHPVHVTTRVRPEAAQLRSRQCFRVVASCIGKVRDRDGFRVSTSPCNRIICISSPRRATPWPWRAGSRPLSIRIAKAINRVLGRRGPVFADRYHAHTLRTPTETANAIAYVLGNSHVHAARRGHPIRLDAIDPLSSAANRQLVATPHTWLLRIGWTLGLPGG